MRKKILLEISNFELKESMGLKGKFCHKRDEKTPTGIKPILEGFYFNEKVIGIDEAKEIILSNLIEMDEIEDRRGWKVLFKPSHGWSSYDEDGYAHSIYSVEVHVYKSI